MGRMPGDRNLLSLDASLAIPTRVLCFEDSGLHRCTPVRPVLHIGQTGPALLVTPVFPEENQVQTYMHAKINFHAYS
jgi:hypothetical protein